MKTNKLDICPSFTPIAGTHECKRNHNQLPRWFQFVAAMLCDCPNLKRGIMTQANSPEVIEKLQFKGNDKK